MNGTDENYIPLRHTWYAGGIFRNLRYVKQIVGWVDWMRMKTLVGAYEKRAKIQVSLQIHTV